MWADASSTCAGGELDRGGGGLDIAHRRVGQRDPGEFALDGIEFALGGVDPGQPGGHPIGLVAVGHSLDGAAGRIDAGLAGLHRRVRFLGRGLGGLLHLAGGGVLLGGLGRGGFHPGDRLGAAVDVGAQPAPFGKRRNGGRVRGIRGGCNHLRLLELSGELGDGVGRGPRRGQPFRRLRPLGGQSREVLGERRMPAHRVVDLGDGGGTPGRPRRRRHATG